MLSNNFKSKILPHLIATAIFFVLTIFFFGPAFFQGKGLQQSDIVAHKGASKELADYRAANGSEALWTNSMFGGMPGYQISTVHDKNFIREAVNTIRLVLPHPYNHLFLAFACAYGLLIILGLSPWMAAAGAVAYGLSSYNIQLFEAGHNSKIEAIAFMPMVLGAVLLILRKKYLSGGLLFAVFFSIEVSVNHLQITYYLGMMIGIIVVFYLFKFLLQKDFAAAWKVALTLAVGIGFGLATNASLLWTTYEYKSETIRGKSELQAKVGSENSTSGLDKSYITQWSYGKGETFSLLVPNFKGGGSGQLKEESAAIKQVNRKYRKTVEGMDRYFGGQPFTSGPVYFGAGICFLFMLALFVYRGPLLWPLLVASALSILLAWGKNLMWFTSFFIEHVPLYNNFRAVSMTLIIAALTFLSLGFLGLKAFLDLEDGKARNTAITGAAVSTLLLLSVFILLPNQSNSFFKPADPLVEGSVGEEAQLKDQLAQYQWPEKQQEDLLEGLVAARTYLFTSDAKRSLLFVLLVAGLIYLYHKNYLSQKYLGPALLVVLLFDLWSVDRRYLNEDSFTSKKHVDRPFEMSTADQYIQQAQSKGRVLNLAANTWNDASTSYLHQSVGGYSAVKLRRYQELYDYELSDEMNEVRSALNSGNMVGVQNTLSTLEALKMMNTRYIIYNPSAPPIVNDYAYGDAWFVSGVEFAQSADEELALTKSLNLADTAGISEQEKGNISQLGYVKDSTQSIKKVKYEPNELTYKVSTNQKALVVFSEVFYNKGWKAFIDEQEVEIARANYVLRALEVPAGNHEIRFEFDPQSYKVGSRIAGLSSGVLLLLLFGVGYKTWKKSREAVA